LTVRYCSPFAVATQSLNVTWNSRRETIDYDFSTIAANISYISQLAWIARSLHIDRTI